MAANPVEYAEQTLGVHLLWEEAQDRLTKLADAQRRADASQQQVRQCNDAIEDREMELTRQLRATYNELSDTAFKERRRELMSTDDTLKTMRQAVRTAQSELDLAESDVKHHTLGLGVLSGRMTELGGLLQFYAAARFNVAVNAAIAANLSMSPQVHESAQEQV